MNSKRAKRLRRAVGFRPAVARTYSPAVPHEWFAPLTVRLDKSEPRVLYKAYKRAMKAARAQGVGA